MMEMRAARMDLSVREGRMSGSMAHCFDRISTLPDSILCFILSFLPTKESVATSVLSKRWKPLWRSVPTIDFDDIHHRESEEDYARFIHSVTALVHLHHPVHKFRIGCFSHFTDPAYITVWANAAVQRRVHHLDLDVTFSFGPTPINLSSIFSCKTLVVLKLKFDFTKVKLKPISSVYLPSLHVLDLDGLVFSTRRCLAKLLRGCPVLEEFRETCLYFISKELKTLPKLLRADISADDTDIMLPVVNNVKFLHINMIFQANIVKNTDSYVFPMFHNLTHIELEYLSCHNDWSELVKLVKHCPKLQVLVINQDYSLDEDEFEEIEYPPSMLHLKLCTEEPAFARYIREDSKEDDIMQWRFAVVSPF